MVAIALAFVPAEGAEPVHQFPAYQRPVMTWVPRYAVGKCKERLLESYGGAGLKDALTHVGLQFWTLTKDGGLIRTGKGAATSDAAITDLRNWGRTNGVRVLLCVYQIGDWELARAGFKEHQATFIRALITEVKRLDLDGVDIDFEGGGPLNADKDAFVAFIRKLSERLHADNRHLTVDTYCYKWNAPNQTWWAELLPHVDGLTSMGYGRIGSKDQDWSGYAAQKAAAGKYASKLMIGLPSHLGEWRDGSLAEHLEWLTKDGEVGVAFWDAQLRNDAWRQPDVWRSLKAVRGRP